MSRRALVAGTLVFLACACAPAPEPGPAPAPQAAPATEAAVCATILSTNDEHGYLSPASISVADGELPGASEGVELGGFAALGGHVRTVREESDCPVFLLSGGDLMQGTAISNLTEGEATIAAMNLLGYDAAAVGNHEFDWGIEVLERRVAQAHFALLSSNIYLEGSDRHPDWARPWTIVERGGVRVGVVGATTLETPWKSLPDVVAGLEFRPIAEALDRYVPELRARGVDFVVAVMHAGALCDEAGRCEGEAIRELRAATEPIDYAVTGHTHSQVETEVRGTPVVQSLRYTAAFGVGRLERRPDGSVARRLSGIRPTFLDVEPDTALARLVAEYRRELEERLSRPVATLARDLPEPGRHREYALGRLIADAHRAAVGARVGLMNNGGIRTGLPAGPVSYGQLLEVLPFGNELVRLELSGRTLLDALEHALAGEPDGAQGVWAHVSGLTACYDRDAPPGRRVAARLEDGEPVRAEETYTVGVNGFMAAGGDGYGMLLGAEETMETGILDIEALIHHLQSLPQPVEAPAEPRWLEASGEPRRLEEAPERLHPRGEVCAAAA